MIFVLAISLSIFIASFPINLNFSNAKFLFIQGAMFFAISAASITIVQLQQKKS
jgi:hypothetical protein